MAKEDWRCGAARDLPINRTRSWDGDAAAKRMLDAADIGGDSPKPAQAKRGFLLYDAGNPNLRGSYKLPFADRIDGKLTAIEAGLDAAASRLPQTDAPEREKDRARQIIDGYEKRMADEDKQEGASAAVTVRLPVAGDATHRLIRVAQSLFNRPLALDPRKAQVVISAFRERFNVAALQVNGEPMAFADADDELARQPDRGYAVIEGAAVIPVCGTLVPKLGSIHPYSGMCGYDGLRVNLDEALADPDVRGILFDVDSPGGDVSGLFDLVDAIHAARGQKPIWAVLTEDGCSAAYAIASAADHVVVPRTGAIGSIGVIAIIADTSKLLDKAGVTVNVIQFGAQKAYGLETLPLSDEARAKFQAEVDTLGTLFVETVARNRRLEPAAIRATEAAYYLGAAGVAAGLADEVLSPEAAFRAFLQLINKR